MCCSVLQRFAACCSVLQCVAACCSVLQRVTVCYSMLQRVAACYSVLQCSAVCGSVLQCVAVFEVYSRTVSLKKLTGLIVCKRFPTHMACFGHVWHASFVRVAWLVHMCSAICVICVSRRLTIMWIWGQWVPLYVGSKLFTSTECHVDLWHIWYDVIICVAWLEIMWIFCVWVPLCRLKTSYKQSEPCGSWAYS